MSFTSAGDARGPSDRERIQRALGDQYEVRELLGRGGFADVWAAFDLRLHRPIAVKVLHAHLSAAPALAERFRREARAVAKLRHPNIVPIYAVDEREGVGYFTMPVVEGETLQSRLEREGTLPVPEARRILVEAAEALHAAHRAGVVHRDIKPENIMLEGEDRRVLLMDFGIAKAIGSGEAALTGHGLILGTPLYMSPEQASGEHHVDYKIDIYSLGAVGYHMLAGRPPFEGASAQELIIQHMSSEPANLRRIRPEIPPSLADAVMRCLRKRPDDRWPTARAFRMALRGEARASGPERLREWVTSVSSRTADTARRHAAWLAGGALVTAAVVATLALSRATYESLRRAGTAAMNGQPAWTLIWNEPIWSPAYPGPVRSLARYRPLWIAGIGDSLLVTHTIASSGYPGVDPPGSLFGRLLVYDGIGWRSVVTPSYHVGPPFQLARQTLLQDLAVQPRHPAVYAWTAGGIRTSDALPLKADSLIDAADALWSNGSTLIAAACPERLSCAFWRRVPSAWRRDPSSPMPAVKTIFGLTEDRLYALSARGQDSVADSLLVYDGLDWRVRAIQPRGLTAVRFAAGATFGDGASVIVGSACPAGDTCRPLVMLQDSFPAAWREVRLPHVEGLKLAGVWGRSRGDFYVWGGHQLGDSAAGCPSAGSCLVHVTNERPSREAAVGGAAVVGMTSLRGVPHILLEDGTVWAYKAGRWAAVAEVPGSALRAVATTATLGPVAVGDAAIATADFLLRVVAPDTSERMTIADFLRVATGFNDVYVLASSGTVYAGACGASGRVGSAWSCPWRPLPAPHEWRARDIAALRDGSVLGLGDGNTIIAWVRGAPHRERVSSAVRGERLRRLVTAGSATFALGDSGTVLRRQVGGSWTADPRFGLVKHSGLTPIDLAVLNDSTVALLAAWWSGETQIQAIRRDSASVLDPATERGVTITSILALPDGRLVAGYALPDYPARGGWIRVWPPGLHQSRRVSFPRRADVYALAQDSRYLYVVGSGWFGMKIRLDSLPYAGQEAH